MVRPKTTILGSRQQLCLNPAVSKLPAAAANQACRSEVSHRSCSWYTNPSLQSHSCALALLQDPTLHTLPRGLEFLCLGFSTGTHC